MSAAIYMILALWVVLLNQATFEGWWSADDPIILQHAIEHQQRTQRERPVEITTVATTREAHTGPVLHSHALFGSFATLPRLQRSLATNLAIDEPDIAHA